MSAVASNTTTVAWQVVEYANTSVQSGDVSFLTTDSSKTATVTSVNTGKAWLLYTHTTAAGTSTDIGQKLVRGRVTNATTLTFDRDHTGQTMDLTWYFVEFTDTTSVQHNTVAFTSTDTQKDVTITSVNTSMSFAVGGSLLKEAGRVLHRRQPGRGVDDARVDVGDQPARDSRVDRFVHGRHGLVRGRPPVPAITVSPTSGLTTTEAGSTATFTVVLTWQPSANVTIGLSSSDTTEGTVSPASLTFTTANWSTAQTVTVTGVNDFLDDGNIAYSIVTAAATSARPVYSGMNASDVAVTTTDDDVSGFTVDPTSGLTTTEAGGTATFTVVLTAQPTANVSTALSTNDATEGTVSPASLTFTTRTGTRRRP